MLDVKFLTVYTGKQLSNFARYGNESVPIVNFLSTTYDFCDYTPKPKRPSKMATARCWNDYNMQLSRHNLQLRNTDKYRLNNNSEYVLTKCNGKFWVHRFDPSKTLNHLGRDFKWNGICYE